MKKLLFLFIIFMSLSWGLKGPFRRKGLPVPTEIIVFDDYYFNDYHGIQVMGVADKWCLNLCSIHPVHTNRRKEDYIDKLSDIVKYVEMSPERRHVINISMGSKEPDEDEIPLIRRLDRDNVIILAAAGNDGMDVQLYPAALDGVIAVAATRSGKKTDYSNYGRHIDICISTPDRFYPESHIEYDTTEGFVTHEIITSVAGTSLSAPKLAGMIALVWGSNPGLSKKELIATMNRHAKKIHESGDLNGKLGAGELDSNGFILANSETAKNLLYLLIIETTIFVALFTIFRWGWGVGIFFICYSFLSVLSCLSK